MCIRDRCALGWSCWKTYLGRPETDHFRACAMRVLGCGLSDANQHEAALSVREAELAMRRRLGDRESNILAVQSNLAATYRSLGRFEEALQMKRDGYTGHLNLYGTEHRETLIEANNYAASLLDLQRFAEAKTLLRKTMPVSRRVLGENDDITLKLRLNYARALWQDANPTLDDLREAVTTLEETTCIARRVLGGAHPLTEVTETGLQDARAALRARETPSTSA